MNSVLNPFVNLILATSLMTWGFVAGLVQAQPSQDIIGLILGPLGAVVLLILIAWYLTKRNKEKEDKIEAMQQSMLQMKDKEIERLQRELGSK